MVVVLVVEDLWKQWRIKCISVLLEIFGKNCNSISAQLMHVSAAI